MEENMNGRCLTFIMSIITRTHVFFLVSLLFLFLFLNTNVAIAASCPCCGRTYGNPMPGDEARVYQLRREHEASCCRKVSKPNDKKKPAIDYEADVKRRQEELRLQQEAERREAECLERERKIKEAETKQKEFEQNKQDVLDSMKGTTVHKPGLKETNATGNLDLKNVGDAAKDNLKLKELDKNKTTSVNSDKELKSKAKKVQKGWQKALSCAMEEIYARAESLGPAGVRFSQDLRNEMTRVSNEAGKPVKDKNDVNIVNLNLDRQVSIGKGSAERQFIVDVAVYSKGNGNVDLDVQSYFSGSTGKKIKEENIQSIMVINQDGEIVMSENSAAVDACLAR